MALNRALIAFKKLFNKPHTSNDKDELANEDLYVGFQQGASTIFSEKINNSSPGSPFSVNTGSFYSQDGIVEKIRLPLTFVSGTDTAQGRHGFAAKLPDDYESNSFNPKAGTGFFKNGQFLVSTTGSIQIVSPFVGGRQYNFVLRDKNLNQIPPLDPREWVLYDFGGLVFQNTPPAVGDISNNPGYLDCWIYIGETIDESINKLEASGSTLTTKHNDTTISTNTQTLNISGSITSASLNGSGNVTYSFDALQEDDRKLALLSEYGGPFEKYTAGSYRECTYVNRIFPDTITWYENNTKAKKIYEKSFIYNSNKTTHQIIRKVYATDGTTVLATATDTITYGSGSVPKVTEVSRTRIIV